MTLERLFSQPPEPEFQIESFSFKIYPFFISQVKKLINNTQEINILYKNSSEVSITEEDEQDVGVNRKIENCEDSNYNKSNCNIKPQPSHKHKSSKFICPFEYCLKIFSTKGNMNVHYTSHQGNRTFLCHYENCEKAYTNKTRLNTHLRTHVIIL